MDDILSVFAQVEPVPQEDGAAPGRTAALISPKLAVIVGIKIRESTSAAPVPICGRKRCAVIC